jgi:hypothetical protein
LALIQAALAEASAAVSTAGSSTGGTNDNSAQVRAWAVLGQALFCSTSFQYLD